MDALSSNKGKNIKLDITFRVYNKECACGFKTDSPQGFGRHKKRCLFGKVNSPDSSGRAPPPPSLGTIKTEGDIKIRKAHPWNLK